MCHTLRSPPITDLKLLHESFKSGLIDTLIPYLKQSRQGLLFALLQGTVLKLLCNSLALRAPSDFNLRTSDLPSTCHPGQEATGLSVCHKVEARPDRGRFFGIYALNCAKMGSWRRVIAHQFWLQTFKTNNECPKTHPRLGRFCDAEPFAAVLNSSAPLTILFCRPTPS